MTEEELRALRARHAELLAELERLNAEIGDADPTDEQSSSWERLSQEETAARDRIATEERRARVAESRARWRSLEIGDRRHGDRFAEAQEVLARGTRHGEWRGADVRSALVRAVEGRNEALSGEDEAHFERVLRRHLQPTSREVVEETRQWAAQLLTRSLPAYERGWAKVMSGNLLGLTTEERDAIAVGTNTAGGYLVPVHLDPTIILTNTGSANVVRQIARVVTLAPGEGNTWKGISSAGVTGSWDAEGTEVSDDSPSFLQPSIPLYTGDAFAKATFEAVEDITDLTGQLTELFADARDRMEGAAHCVGAGSTQPTGIFTALDANTNVEIISTTAATIGVVDVNAVFRALGIRFRRRAEWLMAQVYADAIKALGTAVGASYTSTLAEDLSETLKGKPWNVSDDCPTTQTTTANDNEIVLGAWDNFVIVDRPGSMSVEYISNLTGVTTARPTRERGWLCWWRNGSDSVNDLAFRLLQDKTSA